MSMLAPSARLVGNRISRKEDPRLLTGAGTYVDDVVVPGMLHVAFRAQRRRRAVVSCASTPTAAREAEGVVAVLTADRPEPRAGGPDGRDAGALDGIGCGPYKVARRRRAALRR